MHGLETLRELNACRAKEEERNTDLYIVRAFLEFSVGSGAIGARNAQEAFKRLFPDKGYGGRNG